MSNPIVIPAKAGIPLDSQESETPASAGVTGELFGEAAARLSGAASLLLGWRPDEFWNSTPAELALAITVETTVDAPDSKTIEALRSRFPDERR